MNPENFVLIASVSASLAAVCVVMSLWTFVRMSRLEALVSTLDAKLPHKRIVEMEQCVDQLIQAIDGNEKKNQEFKQSVHNSVQRLDQIMRRNEKAVSASLLDEEGNLAPDVVPGELPAEVGVSAARPVGEAAMSKQKALQLRYNQNRGRV